MGELSDTATEDTRVTRGGRAMHLRLDRTWTWGEQLAPGFARLRAAFA